MSTPHNSMENNWGPRNDGNLQFLYPKYTHFFEVQESSWTAEVYQEPVCFPEYNSYQSSTQIRSWLLNLTYMLIKMYFANMYENTSTKVYLRSMQVNFAYMF